MTSVVDSLGASAEECLRGVDLAVMATDDPSAEAWHSHVLYFLGTPHVSAKLFAKADAGEITLVVPAEGTACLACATGMVADSCRRGDASYGTGRLDGEPALGPASWPSRRGRRAWLWQRCTGISPARWPTGSRRCSPTAGR